MDDDNQHEKDSAELANELGFTGTFADFIAWLERSLVYGSVVVHDPTIDHWGRPVTPVETVTGGYSSDERLLGRLRRAMWPSAAWVRSERGGLDAYEFKEWLTNDEEREWLAPEDGVVEYFGRARTLRVIDRHGNEIKFSFDDGIELVFEEPDRDILEPAGIVTARAATKYLPAPLTKAAPELTVAELAAALGHDLPDEPGASTSV